MSVQFDASTASAEVTTGTTVSVSHTATGTDRAAIVCTLARHFGNGPATLPTGVTYNGVAMSLVVQHEADDVGVSIWRLAAPATGSQSVVATWGDTADGVRYLVAVSCTEADQSTPTEASASNDNEGADPSIDPNVDVTVTTVDSLVIDAVYHKAAHGGVFAATAGQTERFNVAPSPVDAAGVSTKPAPSAGNVTMSWTTNDDVWVQVAAVVKAASGGGGAATPRNLLLLGVG